MNKQFTIGFVIALVIGLAMGAASAKFGGGPVSDGAADGEHLRKGRQCDSHSRATTPGPGRQGRGQGLGRGCSGGQCDDAAHTGHGGRGGQGCSSEPGMHTQHSNCSGHGQRGQAQHTERAANAGRQHGFGPGSGRGSGQGMGPGSGKGPGQGPGQGRGAGRGRLQQQESCSESLDGHSCDGSQRNANAK